MLFVALLHCCTSALYCIIVRMREFDTKFLAGILLYVNVLYVHIKEYQQEILYRTLAFEQSCSTVQKYSSGEVQQITHKGSIQLTILRS